MSMACCNEMSFAQYLCIGEKENLRWIGTYEDLKDFMICFALPNAKWSSPGGDCKMIESDVVSIRWYASSGNLTIKGEKAAAFELKLKTILVCQAEETAIHVEGNIDRLLHISWRTKDMEVQSLKVILVMTNLQTCMETNQSWMNSFIL